MNWIKTRWDQFLLLLFALVLLVFSGLLIVRALAFQEIFSGIRGEVVKSREIEPIDTSALGEALAQVQNPPQWDASPEEGSLFVAQPHIDVDGRLIPPYEEGSPPIHPPVPNQWFQKYDLPILERDVLSQDADNDRFTNMEEFNAGTDPTNVESHPPHWMKLRLAQYIQEPFRLLFSAYTGDPTDVSSQTYQINTLDVSQPTQFVQMNAQISGTPFQIVGFEHKTTVTANQVVKDISELTLRHQETGEELALPLEKMINSPDSYGLFRFLWDNSEFRVKQDQTFQLAPENTTFRLVEISDAQAVIENVETGDKHTIGRLEQQAPER